MSGSSKTNAQSLTGVWNGLYTYPRHLEPVSFVAVLVDSGMSFSGTTHEPHVSNDVPGGMLYGMIDGRREGAAVTFTKTYDGTGGWTHSVWYEGSVNGEATEIEGRWTVPGIWSGKFLMIRSGGKEEAVERKALVPAGET